MRFTKDHEASSYGPECPYCGNHMWMYSHVRGFGGLSEQSHEDVVANARLLTPEQLEEIRSRHYEYRGQVWFGRQEDADLWVQAMRDKSDLLDHIDKLTAAYDALQSQYDALRDTLFDLLDLVQTKLESALNLPLRGETQARIKD